MFLTLLLVTLFAYLFNKVFYEPLTKWKRKNVKQQGIPIPLAGDNFWTLLKKESWADLVKRLYSLGTERYYGMYLMQTPVLMLKDIELIKQITVKDFDHFTDHRPFVPEHIEPLWSKILFALKGNAWRDMRSTLSPAFTGSKMRTMFSLMNDCAAQYAKFYAQKQDDVITLEMKDSFTRYANDVIATCAFGVTVDSLKEPNNEFYVMGKEVSDFSGILTMLKIFLYFLSPKISEFIQVRLFSEVATKFFADIVKDSIKIREEQHIVRPDMINLLMEARKGRLRHEDEDSEHDAGFATVQESHIGKVQKVLKSEITDEHIVAQALVFFFAAFDTVSTLMSFMAYELAINPDIQDKLVAEIIETKKACNGKLTYEDLTKMKYMDMVISETLRKWPSNIAVDRICTRPYTIPPEKDEEQAIQLEVGDIIWVPIVGMHYDPELYPNPNKFDPERFNEQNKHNIKPFTYLPFGVGPRNCIGSRFALMEIKTVFYNLLLEFDIICVPKTIIPIRIDKSQISLSAEGGWWLGLKRRLQ